MENLIKNWFYIVYASFIKQDVYDPKGRSLFMFGFFSAVLFGPLWMISLAYWKAPSFLFPVGFIISYFIGYSLVKSIIPSPDDSFIRSYIESSSRYVHIKFALFLLVVILAAAVLAYNYAKLLAFSR